MSTPAPPRPMSIVKPISGPRANGVLPAPSNTEKPRTINMNGVTSRSSASRLKVVVRRLAPGLTEEEFSTSLGDEWKASSNKVDWSSYRPGKVSRDPSKPSRPSRAYLHLTSEQYLAQLSEKVRKTPFVDAKASSNDSVLLGPPIVEFAPYSRLPTTKPRRDARQGTIDQDQEFIDFLESLTNPLPKAANIDAVVEKEGKADDSKVVTPLIQYLKDKKANKGKDPAAPGKPTKHARQESKETKTSQSEKKVSSKGGKENSAAATEKKSTTPAKIEKAPREIAKAPPKQPASSTKVASQSPAPASPAPKAASEQKPVQVSTPPAPKQERRRERGSASAAAKILQRDLGIAPNPQSRRKREGAPSTSRTNTGTAQMNSDATADNVASSPSTVQKAPAPASVSSNTAESATAATPVQPPTAPAAVRNQTKTQVTQGLASQPHSQASNASKSPALPVVTPGATQAFLKHANPSQGVTEPLLEEAFAVFGTVQKVEIDKKKGFAYVDFADPDGLRKAITASPIKVAQGQVVVLERKTGASLQNRNVRTTGAGNSVRGTSGPQAARGTRGAGGRGRGSRPQGSASKSSATSSQAPATTAQMGNAAAQNSES